MSKPEKHGGMPFWLSRDLELLSQQARMMAPNQEGWGGQYQGYTRRFAEPSRAEGLANELAMQHGSFLPYLQNAQRMNAQASQGFPGQAETYMNPYMQNVTDRIAQMGNRNLTETILPALEAKFVRLGQHGGKGHRDMSARLARDIQGEISAAQGHALHQGYGQAMQGFNQDQLRKLQAGTQEAELGRQHNAGRLADYAAMRQTGQQERELAERPLQAQEEEFRREKQHPRDTMALWSSILHGTPYDRPQFTEGGPQRSMHSRDWGGLAMRGLGALGQSLGGMKKGGSARHHGKNSIKQFRPGA